MFAEIAMFAALLTTSGKPNPAVTQTNIHQTVCAKGWTDSVRPPTRYTRAAKTHQMRELHLHGKPSAYEEDHVIPLEIGGHPTDLHNLRPQRWPEARKKDLVENWLHRQVCAEAMTLIDAQQAIPIWPDLYRQLTGKRP
jgi:hypothetical protein